MKTRSLAFIVLFSLPLAGRTQTNSSSSVKVQNNGNKTTIQTTKGKIEIQPGTSNPNATKFSFLGSYTMKFTTKDKQGKTTTGEIRSAFDEYKMASIPNFTTGMSANVRTIFDTKANTMTMLFIDPKKNKKNGMMMKMPQVTITGTDKSTTAVTSTIQKTVETKIIDGYKCTKWVITYSNGDKCEAWVTKDLSINTAEAIAYCTSGLKGKKSPINTEGANLSGCTLESTFSSADGSSVFMKLTDVRKGKPDAAFFSTDGFEITDVTGIQFFK